MTQIEEEHKIMQLQIKHTTEIHPTYILILKEMYSISKSRCKNFTRF
ncbi:unnamed protein product [Paramecium octaurelia]|uniref:Uncharacterized protein n=1 Tax=Paramecium octaurelia TaxID=43137 RepID=A0A8S1VTP4_PAROT|nr:unnamed protein product [Paramecium octaurelia]